MRIAYAINEQIGAPGIGTPAAAACTALEKQGWLSQALALGARENLPYAVTRVVPFGKLLSNLCFGVRKMLPGFPTYTIRDGVFDALAARALQRCDIFHGWNDHCLRTLRAAKNFGARTIVERGSTHIDFQNRMLREEYRRFSIPFPPIEPTVLSRCRAEFAAADHILVNSAFSARTFPKSLQKKIRCIPRGIDGRRFSIDRRQHPWPKQFTALYVGLISLRKGIPYLLEAWEKAKLHHAKLVLVGPVHPDARRIVARYRNNPTIAFAGPAMDPRTHYRNASVLVLPSLEEGSAKVTFEAMAAGLPVITTPNSGSAVRQGKEGMIVPIRSSAAITRALQHFAADRKRIAACGQCGQRTVRQYSEERYQKRMIQFYREVASGMVSARR